MPDRGIPRNFEQHEEIIESDKSLPLLTIGKGNEKEKKKLVRKPKSHAEAAPRSGMYMSLRSIVGDSLCSFVVVTSCLLGGIEVIVGDVSWLSGCMA